MALVMAHLYSAFNAVKQDLTNTHDMVSYLKQYAPIHYGLSAIEVRTMAYNYVGVNNTNRPDS